MRIGVEGFLFGAGAVVIQLGLLIGTHVRGKIKAADSDAVKIKQP